MARTQVLGARGRVAYPMKLIELLRTMSGGEVLLLNADRVCGKEHVLSAIRHAERAFQLGKNAADGMAMETMLYASGERQLVKAQDKMGLKVDDVNTVIVLFDGQIEDEQLKSLDLERDDGVMDFDRSKVMRFGVTAEELAPLPDHMSQDLVLERVAFVDVLKR